MKAVVAIVSADGPANVGDLLCDLSTVGCLEGKETPAAAVENLPGTGATLIAGWLAYWKKVLAEFGDWV
jgi:hypothetical protein